MTQELSAAEAALRDAAREYHRNPSRGKISVTPTKPLSNQRDLSLAYSPGVAYPCLDIQADPSKAFDYTSRGNLVGVITNGTAVLGLGDIGPLAGKPVMEGKGCLFKKFAGVDVFDIELDERDPDKLIDIIAALEPTLGGINLEDIKAPECFYIERELSKRMNIPVFHDDQHGTAIISSAALLNGLELVGKDIGAVKIAVSGAGAAAIACLDVMVGLGVKIENIFVCDSKGVIYEGRPGGYDESKARYAQKTDARTLADAVNGADVFLGCSAPGVMTAEMVKGTDVVVIIEPINTNFNGGKTKLSTMGSPPVNFAYYEWLATHLVAGVYSNGYQVIIVTQPKGSCYHMNDFLATTAQGSNNGKTLIVFTFTDNICLTKTSDGRQFGPSVLAPFSNVTLADAGYIDGIIIARRFTTVMNGNSGSEQQLHGNVYCG